MTTFSLFKKSITHPSDLFAAKDLSIWKATLYFFFLGFILLIPYIVQTATMLGTFQHDMTKIVEKMPEFSIENNQLTTKNSPEKEQSFLYQTSYMNFTFDPDGLSSAKDVQKDLTGNKLGVGLLKDKLVIASTDESIFTSLLGDSMIEADYQTINTDTLTRDFFEELTFSSRNKAVIITAVFLLMLIPIFLDFALSLVIGTFIAHTFSGARLFGLKYGGSFKLMMFSSTIPVIVCSIAAAFIPELQTSFIIIFVAMLIYFQNIRTRIKNIIG